MKNETVPEISKKEFNSEIKSGFVLVDFYADWCMPCVMMSPILDGLAQKFNGKVKFIKINIDDAQELAQKFNIVSIPNFILFKDGKQVAQFIGAVSEEEFEKRLGKFV
ncbi:thioredoxin [Candidatus Pacearchaeota archaeon]|nr:thioredoxin [Candidatus Pacearchaeota archaeon]